MKWEGQRESENVEDARGGGGGRGGLPIGGRGIGLGGIVIALLASWVLGVNPLTVLGLLSGDGGGVAPVQAPAGDSHAQDPAYRFVKVVLADTEDVWGAYFRQRGETYAMPKLRVFRGSEPTACGQGEAAMGPFYCPADRKVYIDLSFYDTLRRRLGAPGDFAQAYVIAHEVGHHVQTLLGTSAEDAASGSPLTPEVVDAEQIAAVVSRCHVRSPCEAVTWSFTPHKALLTEIFFKL